MITRLLIGIALGGCIGALMGHFGKCNSGACPLTATPFRGAIYGGIMGALFASSMANTRIHSEPSEYVVQVNSAEDFEREVINSETPCLADFYSDRCGACVEVAPTIERLGKDYQNRAKICKIDLGAVPKLADEYNIIGIPCVIFFNKGKEVERLVGIESQKTYEAILDRLTIE